MGKWENKGYIRHWHWYTETIWTGINRYIANDRPMTSFRRRMDEQFNSRNSLNYQPHLKNTILLTCIIILLWYLFWITYIMLLMIFLGTEIKCPVGETSDNEGFTPGCECMYYVFVSSNQFSSILFHTCNEQCIYVYFLYTLNIQKKIVTKLIHVYFRCAPSTNKY